MKSTKRNAEQQTLIYIHINNIIYSRVASIGQFDTQCVTTNRNSMLIIPCRSRTDYTFFMYRNLLYTHTYIYALSHSTNIHCVG